MSQKRHPLRAPAARSCVSCVCLRHTCDRTRAHVYNLLFSGDKRGATGREHARHTLCAAMRADSSRTFECGVLQLWQSLQHAHLCLFVRAFNMRVDMFGDARLLFSSKFD